MKAIICGLCSDVRALRENEAVSCLCGNAIAWWVDPFRGTAKVKAFDQHAVRILGMHNTFLKFAFDGATNGHPSWYVDELWRKQQEDVVTVHSDGYLFHRNKRNCPFVIIKIGESNDVSWATADDQIPRGDR